jgi:tRNA A-37 threonylcarbamoyl transferase component Bud32
MSQTVYNIKTKRQVTINGQQYKKLIKEGYYVDQNQLHPPRLKTFGSTPVVTPIASPKSPAEKVFESTIVEQIIRELEPLDLLSLYLTNKEFRVLDKPNILNYLSQKYNLQVVNSFHDFIKLYNFHSINPSLRWLYQLENEVEMPQEDYINETNEGKREVTFKMRAILLDWIYEVAGKQHFNILEAFGLTVNLIDLFCSQYVVKKTELQLVGVCCLHLACTVILEQQPEIADYIFMTNGTYTKKQMENMLMLIFTTLKGVLIRPIAELYTTNQQIKDLITLSYLRYELIIYKPSMIAEAARYLITGQYKIYTAGELSRICNLIHTTVHQSLKSSLNNFRQLGENVLPTIKYTCFTDQHVYKKLAFKYNHSWHIGTYTKISTLGQGAYGKVRKIKQACGTELVMKTNIQKDNNEATMLEISSLKLLNNQYIVPLCGFDIEWNKSTLYLPLGQGTLDKTLDKNKLTQYMIQITKGVKACHDNDVIHRDLKPQNIVYFEKDDVYKLIDFGLSVPYASFRQHLMPDVAATLWWRAPEALLGDPHYTTKIDIWALGCIFYFMVTGTNPFTKCDETQMMTNILINLSYNLDETWPEAKTLPDWYPSYLKVVNTKESLAKNQNNLQAVLNQYYNVIINCLTLNPKNRPTADDVLVMLNQL